MHSAKGVWKSPVNRARWRTSLSSTRVDDVISMSAAGRPGRSLYLIDQDPPHRIGERLDLLLQPTRRPPVQVFKRWVEEVQIQRCFRVERAASHCRRAYRVISRRLGRAGCLRAGEACLAPTSASGVYEVDNILEIFESREFFGWYVNAELCGNGLYER